jgi:hypothetical protein
VAGDVTPDVPTDVPQGDVPSEEGDVPLVDLPEEVADAPALPDPAFIHAVREHADKVVDSPALIDEPVQYSMGSMPDPEVRKIVVVGDTVWVGTGSGIARYNAVTDVFDGIGLPQDPSHPGPLAMTVLDMAASPDGTLIAVALRNAFHILGADGDILRSFTTEDPTIAIDVQNDGSLVVGTQTDMWAAPAAGDFTSIVYSEGWDVRDVLYAGGSLFTVTTSGMVYRDDQPLTLPEEPGVAIGLARAGDDGVLIACTDGIARADFSGNVETILLPGKGGLPTDMVTSAVQSGNSVLVGHAIGASAVTIAGGVPASAFDHYVGERWIANNAVMAVAIDSSGSRWLGTPGGATRVRLSNRRIADKVGPTFDLWMAHFWRMGGFLMSDAGTDDAWNPTVWTTSDYDNDGLWTQMGIGALCMAYSVTQDEKYYQAARKAMDNMFLLIDVPAVDFEQTSLGRGFITRSLVREDEGALYTSKLTQTNWHPVTYKGLNYVWKDDTSSDETTGHFFGFPLFYDLCAKDDAERAAVAEHAGALAKYIVDGGYTLRDLDGMPTSFGHYEPSHVSIAVDGLVTCSDNGYSIDDCVGAMYGAGWLNGIEILGHLLATWHMTGDRFFYDAYETLISTHRYDEVAVTSRDAETVTNPKLANHSDHELAMLAYATLIRYEPNADRRAKWIDSLLGMYEFEIPERQPLWAAIVALATAGQAEVPAAVQTLREMPQDLRDWAVDNTHRKDAVHGPSDRFENPQWTTVFPYDEIRTMWWNGNPYAVAGGSWGRNTVSPTAFQLAYWAQRYAGILVDPPAK